MALQVTTSTGLAPGVRVHYNANLLDQARPELVHARYAVKKTIPKHEGRTVKWRRYQLLTPATTPLTEGVTPAGSDLTQDEVTVTVGQYGDYVKGSDRVQVEQIDNTLQETSDLQGQQSGMTFDIVAREVMNAGTNVRYANGRVSRVTVAAGDIITDAEIKKLRRSLRRKNARPIKGMGAFLCIVHPDTYNDLMNTDAYLKTGEYQDKEKIYDGMVSKLYGIMFVESTNAKVFAGAGASGIDVYSSVCYGDNAIGDVDIAGLKLETIYKAIGSGGTEDPLDQRWSMGWKGTYACVILNQDYLVRLEHAVSA